MCKPVYSLPIIQLESKSYLALNNDILGCINFNFRFVIEAYQVSGNHQFQERFIVFYFRKSYSMLNRIFFYDKESSKSLF
jgi:hypothetical protein